MGFYSIDCTAFRKKIILNKKSSNILQQPSYVTSLKEHKYWYYTLNSILLNKIWQILPPETLIFFNHDKTRTPYSKQTPNTYGQKKNINTCKLHAKQKREKKLLKKSKEKPMRN